MWAAKISEIPLHSIAVSNLQLLTVPLTSSNGSQGRCPWLCITLGCWLGFWLSPPDVPSANPKLPTLQNPTNDRQAANIRLLLRVVEHLQAKSISIFPLQQESERFTVLIGTRRFDRSWTFLFFYVCKSAQRCSVKSFMLKLMQFYIQFLIMLMQMSVMMTSSFSLHLHFALCLFYWPSDGRTSMAWE